MDKKVLNAASVQNQVELHPLYGRKGSWMLPVGCVFFLIFWMICTFYEGSFSLFAFLSCGIMVVLPMCSLFLYLYFMLRRTSSSLEKQKYYIVEDHCRDKKYSSDNEGSEEYLLYFSKHGKYKDAFGGNYKNTDIGDGYYLLLFPGSKKIRYIFPKKLWELDASDFVKKDGIYRPKN